MSADLEPFKGLLLGLFFVTVSMAANVGLLQSEPLRVIAVTGGFLAIKVMAIAAIGRAAGQSGESARKLGFTLPSGGEFAFVLFTLAARADHTGRACRPVGPRSDALNDDRPAAADLVRRHTEPFRRGAGSSLRWHRREGEP